jgi:hypothetical protein
MFLLDLVSGPIFSNLAHTGLGCGIGAQVGQEGLHVGIGDLVVSVA